jgi:hypothetical protein
LTDHGADAVLRSRYLANLREFQVTCDQNFAASFAMCERLRELFGRNAVR